MKIFSSFLSSLSLSEYLLKLSVPLISYWALFTMKIFDSTVSLVVQGSWYNLLIHLLMNHSIHDGILATYQNGFITNTLSISLLSLSTLTCIISLISLFSSSNSSNAVVRISRCQFSLTRTYLSQFFFLQLCCSSTSNISRIFACGNIPPIAPMLFYLPNSVFNELLVHVLNSSESRQFNLSMLAQAQSSGYLTFHGIWQQIAEYVATSMLHSRYG